MHESPLDLANNTDFVQMWGPFMFGALKQCLEGPLGLPRPDFPPITISVKAQMIYL